MLPHPDACLDAACNTLAHHIWLTLAGVMVFAFLVAKIAQVML
jgi:hypothetical protein